MNKEVIKAMNKKNTTIAKIRRWWSKNGYKVNRVILFPLWIGIIIKDKINEYLNNKQVWNEEKANNILNYYVPRHSEWLEDKKQFHFFDNGCGWSIGYAKYYLKRKDRRFWNCNAYRIRDYLVDTFELEGFTKEIISNQNYLSTGHWVELTFTLNE